MLVHNNNEHLQAELNLKTYFSRLPNAYRCTNSDMPQ
jgi:hypothetical protein